MRRKNAERPIFSMRFKMVLVVAAEIVVSISLGLLLGELFDRYILTDQGVPLFVYLIIFSLLVGVVVTAWISRLFFDPIKQLRLAMGKVAKGDFTIQLQPKSSSREIRDIYSGFNLMTQELRSTEVLQTDFVSNVSHEFKTPLGAIEGYATLLQDCDNLTPQQREYVEKIVFNTQRLSSLTGSILLLSKLENQQIPTGRTAFSLDEQIRQTIVELEPAWSGKELDFDAEMESVSYFGNEPLMRRVWSNLLSNAIKFSPPGGMIRIGLTQQDRIVTFWVRDDGPGIPEEAMKHVFTRFYQADSSHKQEGNGLGLALVSKILALENGTIGAENCQPGGCKFTVQLHNK